MKWSMSYSSSAYEMVRTTLLDCYRWEFSCVVQRRGKRRHRARASSTIDGGDVRGDGGLLGRVGSWPRARLMRWPRAIWWRQQRRPEVEALSGRHLEVDPAASGAMVDAESSGGGGGRSWRRRRRRRRRRLEFCFIFSTRTAPITSTPSNYVFVMGLGLSYWCIICD
jgi:hypothetical protein